MKTLICPECKNEVDLAAFFDRSPAEPGRSGVKIGQIIECNSCGITLEITNDENEKLETEIVDEGK